MPKLSHACATVRETAASIVASIRRIIGLTPVDRTTVYVLNMNRPDRVRVRLELEPETFLG
jgi:hypothetical protein